MVEQLFLAVLQGCLWFVVVVFPDHNHLLFLLEKNYVTQLELWCSVLILRLHYVTGSHGSCISGHRGGKEVTLAQVGELSGQT